MKGRVLITRELTNDSPFRRILEARGYKVHGESLIRFQGAAFASLPETDWIFFYSKRAVRYFLQGLEGLGASLPEKTQLAALGPGTAGAVSRMGLKVDFEGDGDPENTASRFLDIAHGLRVLFPRALHSRQSVQQMLEGSVQMVDLVVYRNEQRRDFNLDVFYDFLVFTSPMNAQAYFAKYERKKEQQIIAIGQTTAQALVQLGISKVRIAKHPTEADMANAVMFE